MTEATKKTTRTRKASASKATTTVKKTKAVSLELPRNALMFEILDLVSRQRTAAKKVEALQKHSCQELQMLLIWNFDESISSVLPEGEVPYGDPEDQLQYSGSLSESLEEKARQMYTANDFSLGSADGNGRTTIRAQAKNFYHFLEGGNPGLSKMRRESMFINLLQGLHPLEAELVILAKDGLIGDRYKITQEVVSEAFPEIKWGGRG